METTKLKCTNIISYTTCNDVAHAVALLAPSGAPLRGTSMLLVLFLVNLQTQLQVPQARDGNIP